MFDVHSVDLSDSTTQYKLVQNGRSINFGEVLRLWQDDPEFCLWYSSVLAASRFSAFRWETPPILKVRVDREFEFVLVEANSFVTRKTNPRAFETYFSDDPVTAFPNLGGDSIMVVPSPQTSADIYGHFGAFLRGAEDGQIIELWKMIGEEMSKRVGEKPVWLSTAGCGVAWLHVRIDSRPKYYHYRPYRESSF